MGAMAHAVWPGWMRPLHVGAVAFAMTQFFPVIQLVLGLIAIEMISPRFQFQLFDDEQMGVTVPPEVANPLSFLVVLGTGLPLIGLALLTGITLERFSGSSPTFAWFRWNSAADHRAAVLNRSEFLRHPRHS